MNIQEMNFTPFVEYVKRQNLPHQITEQDNLKRLDVHHGKFKCIVTVYHTGKINIQGSNSKLKDSLEFLKQQVENVEEIPELLPFEIESFPQKLSETISHIDPVILYFLEEAIKCYKFNSVVGCAFLLGAASERAIQILVKTFGEAIDDETNRERFKGKVGKKSAVLKSYEEFEACFKACKTRPTEIPVAVQDFLLNIKAIFQFYRICRNEAGHPDAIPNLDKGVLLANMGQFVKYMESIYFLIDFYSENKVEL